LDGKNDIIETIRSQAPKIVMIDYGEGSETRWKLVEYEDLISLILLKV